MARVRLTTRVTRTLDLQTTYGAAGAVIRSPICRLVARILFVEPTADVDRSRAPVVWEASRQIDAVVDTGAGISIFPFQI